ncbi:MAG: D-tyrosyl-tRNA(Tyr) deacylase [Phycisphaerales bacterium]|nr:D-tyrosyl-tRNA(Tyr) deacylase [Phycisphaerales bacterium]
MIAVIQRVRRASVQVDSQIVGAIEQGLLVLLGIARGDDESDVLWMVKRITHLRIFADAAGKMNCDVCQTRGAVLIVSQFTLLADLSNGNRPGFSGAEDPVIARQRCDAVSLGIEAMGIPTARGAFAAHMLVTLENDGPVTITLDSRARRAE